MSGSTFASQIEEHMAVVGSDGEHVSTVDKVEGDRIKLTKQDDPDGSGQHHHYLPVSAVASVEGGEVRLDGDQAAAWLRTSNDLRLALGTRLDISEDTEPPEDVADEEDQQLAVYYWLTALQGSLVDALVASRSGRR